MWRTGSELWSVPAALLAFQLPFVLIFSGNAHLAVWGLMVGLFFGSPFALVAALVLDRLHSRHSAQRPYHGQRADPVLDFVEMRAVELGAVCRADHMASAVVAKCHGLITRDEFAARRSGMADRVVVLVAFEIATAAFAIWMLPYGAGAFGFLLAWLFLRGAAAKTRLARVWTRVEQPTNLLIVFVSPFIVSVVLLSMDRLSVDWTRWATLNLSWLSLESILGVTGVVFAALVTLVASRGQTATVTRGATPRPVRVRSWSWL
jgi:hypothetical protein